METVSCKRKMIHIRAATQNCIGSLKRKQNNAKKDKTQGKAEMKTQSTFLHMMILNMWPF